MCLLGIGKARLLAGRVVSQTQHNKACSWTAHPDQDEGLAVQMQELGQTEVQAVCLLGKGTPVGHHMPLGLDAHS